MFTTHSSYHLVPITLKAMSTQLDIVYRLKEVLETGNPEVVTPFMADDFTHQALPTQYVLSVWFYSSKETGTDVGGFPTRLGAPRCMRDQWKVHVVTINSRLKSVKVETCILCGLRAQKPILVTPQFDIIDIIDNPGSITLEVS